VTITKECTIETVRKKAALWHAEGKEWHIHMLSPNCVFNEHSDQHAFVLENRTDQQTYIVYSDEPQIEADHALVILLHGDQILDKEKITMDPTNAQMQVILQRCREFNQRKILWHHHILFPDCIFNQQKGKWTIFFENNENNEVVEVLYNEQPVDDLRQIEILFFERETQR